MRAMTRSILVAMAAAALLASCGRPQSASSERPAALTPTQTEARLAAADLADGTPDKVVSKCANCRLGMAGGSQHVSTYAGYELHFCSADCKKEFDADPGAVIGRLPDKPKS